MASTRMGRVSFKDRVEFLLTEQKNLYDTKIKVKKPIGEDITAELEISMFCAYLLEYIKDE